MKDEKRNNVSEDTLRIPSEGQSIDEKINDYLMNEDERFTEVGENDRNSEGNRESMEKNPVNDVNKEGKESHEKNDTFRIPSDDASGIDEKLNSFLMGNDDKFTEDLRTPEDQEGSGSDGTDSAIEKEKKEDNTFRIPNSGEQSIDEKLSRYIKGDPHELHERIKDIDPDTGIDEEQNEGSESEADDLERRRLREVTRVTREGMTGKPEDVRESLKETLDSNNAPTYGLEDVIGTESESKEEKGMEKDKNKERKNEEKTYSAEHLPLGTGYRAENLPTEKVKPEVIPVKDEISEVLNDDPVPMPEDEYYDYSKDMDFDTDRD